MALSLPDLWLITRLKQQGHIPAGCSVADIGVQPLNDSIINSNGDLEELGRAFGVRTAPPVLAPGKPDNHDPGGAPQARLIWQWLGVPYLAIDSPGIADAEPLDLNFDSAPINHRSRYWAVMNFGTTEHVANQLNAFRVIHDLTAVGGIMIHHLPRAEPGHGLFNYSDRFMWALCRANDYAAVFDEVRPNSLTFVLQRKHDFAFVPPLDVDDDVSTENFVLTQRYWTVFKRDVLARIDRSRQAYLAQREAAVFQREQEIARHDNYLKFQVARTRRWLGTRFPILRRLKRRPAGK
jgi:SAM-dependent methyltransferase